MTQFKYLQQHLTSQISSNLVCSMSKELRLLSDVFALKLCLTIYLNIIMIAKLADFQTRCWAGDRFLVGNKNSVGISYFTQARDNPDQDRDQILLEVCIVLHMLRDWVHLHFSSIYEYGLSL